MKTKNIKNSLILSRVETIGKLALFLWMNKGNGEFLQKVCDHRQFLIANTSPEWWNKFDKLSMQYLGGLVAAGEEMWQMIKECYRQNAADFRELCRRIYLSEETLDDVKAFNRALNAVYSFRFLGELEDVEAFAKLATEVLKTYPDYGYKPKEDELFDEKVFEGRIPYVGELEIRLLEAEIIAEENEKLAKMKGKRRGK